VLASPHVLRLLEACATAEDAAFAAALTGKSRHYVSQAVGVCLGAIAHWHSNTTQVGGAPGRRRVWRVSASCQAAARCIYAQSRHLPAPPPAAVVVVCAAAMCRQPDTLPGLYRARHPQLNATLLRRCVKLRKAVYLAAVGDGLASRAVRRAVYT
jgi:hypothetical protein